MSFLHSLIRFRHINKWLLALHLVALFFAFANLFRWSSYLLSSGVKAPNRYFSLFFTFESIGPFLTLIFLSFAFYLYRYKLNYIPTWKGFNLFGLRIALIYSIFLGLNIFLIGLGEYEAIGLSVVYLLLVFSLSVLLGIFFQKASIKKKLKDLLSIILFVWAVYKIYNSIVNRGKFSYDTDGDGKIDTVLQDFDGDGVLDTQYIDIDGDGVFETIARDTTGNGLIDTIASDVSGDGKIDTILKDLDGDGLADIKFKGPKGKGLA